MDKQRLHFSFQEKYASLNAAQKLVVDSIEGPMIVIAGPGTGKTEVISLRIANILQRTDVLANNILALTYTDAAAKNMVDRLSSFIGTRAYQVEIKTFHSFCEDIIHTHPEFFSFDRESEAVDEIEKYEIFHTLLSNPTLTSLRTPSSAYHFLHDIEKNISDLKQEGVTPLAFDLLVQKEENDFLREGGELKKTEKAKREELISKHKELAILYKQYQEELQKRKRYDFQDMIIQTLQALLQNEVLLLENQERFQYILVDEYQDTNTSQNAVIDLLASYWDQEANICVVADPNQTIYRFQGASLENTLGFLARYPKALNITLEVGYRCTQAIYDSASMLISNNEKNVVERDSALDFYKPLRSVRAESYNLQLNIYSNPMQELSKLAESILGLLDKDPSTDIAILCKKNSQCALITTYLDSYDIKYSVETKHDVLSSLAVKQLLVFLEVINSISTSTESNLFFQFLNYSWLGLDPLIIMKLSRSCSMSKTNRNIYDLIMTGFESVRKLAGFEKLTPLEFLPFESLCQNLTIWKNSELQIPLTNWLPEIMQLSGFMDWIVTNPEFVSDVNALFAQLKSWNMANHNLTLSLFLNTLETIKAHNLSIAKDSLVRNRARVFVCTVHKAKGREWDVVYLPFMVNKNWGNTRPMNGIPLPEGILRTNTPHISNDDERRLLYVALTRARLRIYLSYSTTTVSDSKSKDQNPSQFLDELPQKLLDKENVVINDIDNTEIEIRLLRPINKINWTQEQRDWLLSLVEDISLSASTLNMYLRSPLEFYQHVLLKVPQTKPPHMIFGIAVHAALEYYYNFIKNNEGNKPSINAVLERFDQILDKEIISQNDLELRRNQGNKLLTTYLQEHQDDRPQVLTNEESFGWKRGRVMLDDVSLTGKIDRIDILDEEKRFIKIIDYKTGKPKTIGEIEGTTANANLSPQELALPASIRGSYKRQLVFYVLLLSLDRGYKNFIVKETQFEFVESHMGKFTTRSFTIQPQEIEDLKSLIVQCMKEIRSLSFLDTIYN